MNLQIQELSRFLKSYQGVSDVSFNSMFEHPFLIIDPYEELDDGEFYTGSFKNEGDAALKAIEQDTVDDSEQDDPLLETHTETEKGTEIKLNDSARLRQTDKQVVYFDVDDPVKNNTMVSIGRSSNNMIVFINPKISKFHAYFRSIGAGMWEISDGGSTNGTFVEGKLLEKDSPFPLNGGETISFSGRVIARFETPKSMFDLVSLGS